MANFENAVAFVLHHEGGYVNDPKDPGGETKFGISKRSYPNEDIANLTVDRAKEIYKRDYWVKAGCDALSDPLALVHFDTAVNCGLGTATRFSKECQGDYEKYLLCRVEHYTTLAKKPNLRGFLLGWLNRVVDLFMLIKEC